MKRCLTNIWCVALVSALVVTAGFDAAALGFRNPDQGARATGQGEAFAAQADDASAVYYNPAGLVQVPGGEITSGGYLLFPSSEYSGATFNEEMDAASILPHFYAAMDFGLERWRFGLGVNVPFGNLAEYSQSSPFAFTAYDASLAVFNFAPAAAYQVNDQLSVGLAVNIYYGDTELKRLFALAPGFGPPFNFEGDGMAAGVTLGVLYKLNDRHAFGLVYRSPFEIEFDGNAKLDPLPAILFPGVPRSSASADIEFPQTVTVGYAYRPIEDLKLEVDIEWTNWDTLNDVILDWPAAAFLGGTPPIPFHWEDSLFYEFGAEYRFAEHWVARAGYIFSENSIPDSTFSSTVPDSDRHVLSVGLGYISQRFSFDIAYQLSVLESRTVSNSAENDNLPGGDADGKWEGEGHALIMTGSWRF